MVNGIGGIGKSELAYEYLHQYKSLYDRIAVVKMVEEQKSLEETLFFSFPKLSDVNGEKNFNTLIKQLQGFKGKNLLIIDNLQSSDDFKMIKPLSLNFDVLITTRIKLDRQFKSQSRDELKELLKILALFPAIEIEFKILEKTLGVKRLKSKLQKLVNQGWLIKKDNSYKLHQIIKLFMREEYPVEYKDITYILDNIGNHIDPDDSTLIASQLSDYIPIIDFLLTLFGDKIDKYIAGILDSNTYLYYSLGEYDNSLEMQKQSCNIREKLYGNKSKEVAKSYELLGIIYKSKGKYDKAEPFFEKALKIHEKVLGKNHPDTASSYNSLGFFYKERKECAKAKEYLEKAIASVERLEYSNLSLIHLRRALKDVNKSIKDEKKAKFKKRGRFCVDMKK